MAPQPSGAAEEGQLSHNSLIAHSPRNERWSIVRAGHKMALRKGIFLSAIQKDPHERLDTTALHLNLIDMHVIDEYTQKW